MKSSLILFFSLFALNAFAKGAQLNRWVCYMDIRETRWEREGAPLEARGRTKDEAKANVYGECRATHERHYPGLCRQVMQSRPDAIACQLKLGVGFDW